MTHIIITLNIILFSTFLIGQERFDSLLVKMDRRWLTNKDSVQIIVYTYTGDASWDWKVTALYKDLSGKWYGLETETLSKSKGQKIPIDKREFWEDNNNYVLSPKTDWTNIIQYLFQLKIDSLPNMYEIDGIKNIKVRDGSLHKITFRNSKLNRTVEYVSPYLFRRKYWQVRNAIKIINIADKFVKEEK